MKYLKKIVTHRVTYIAFSFLIQVTLLLGVILSFSELFVIFYGFSILLSLFVVIYILNLNMNPAYKLTWIIPIMTFPIFGGILYLLYGLNRQRQSHRVRSDKIAALIAEQMPHKPELLKKMSTHSVHAGNQSRYIQNFGGFPPFEKTQTLYFENGEKKFEALIKELGEAKEFIFMEYFIIQEGVMWNQILDILKAKVKEGVDVRIIYDDLGCLFTLPKGYYKTLESYGIKTCVFNPLRPIVSSLHNNRDHRKITVIDGHTGFTGGINLADEYINEYVKYGHWKDSAIMIKGPAVHNMTMMFLSLWLYLRKEEEALDKYVYMPETEYPEDGFVQPFSDSPLDGETVGENVYLNLINKAKRYVYITTPYLVLDNETVVAMTTAAKSGVDIRIITPHIPDKKFVHDVTRSFYEVLIKSGVKIYEYTPGFIHSKTYVSDDRYGVVGTINMDFRSLYLHFECGVWLYQNSAVMAIKEDFLETLDKSMAISLDIAQKNKQFKSAKNAILRVFAPFL